ncbi:tyrosine-type recombinase/integrase [Pseudochrobactrum sp. MP213Fo]|uniref:tyrosine-type recombinase/integrase n=1 Tax=Pseudochrobactrum sp. MP213Fo TaxID=3022250 RepID=UPI003B9E587A
MPKIKSKLPLYVVREVSRHGRVKYFYRIGKGERIRLPDELNTPEFKEAYKQAIIGYKIETPRGIISPPNTLRWLIDHYRESSSWKAFSPATRKQRENIFLNVIKRSNNTLYTAIDRKSIVAAVEARSETPAQANHFLKAMRGVFSWALQNDYVVIDPTAGVFPLKYKSAGFAPWTMTDLLQFFDRWPIGSKPRLAVELLLHTGLRRSDVVRAGWQHLRGSIFTLQTQKTGSTITIEFPNALLDVISATETGSTSFLISEAGTPFATESFGNWFRDRCNDAGIKKSAHGLRKLSATLSAEAGAATHELMAQYGWSNVKQAELYTKGADRVRLCIRNSRRVAGQIETEIALTRKLNEDSNKDRPKP